MVLLYLLVATVLTTLYGMWCRRRDAAGSRGGLMASSASASAEFSPIENEAPLRWLRRLHLVPADGLGARRRALFLALLTWLPIVAWAMLTGRLPLQRASR